MLRSRVEDQEREPVNRSAHASFLGSAASLARIPLVDIAESCQTPRPWPLRNFIVVQHIFHSISRKTCMAAILASVTIAGCAAFNSDNWNPNRLRDDRAVEIDKRLEGAKPIVVNPF